MGVMPIPDYVLSLRAHVGHDLLWLPGVTVVVRDSGGRVLLAQRADNGRWALISGIVDPGEEPAIAARREVREEAGLPVTIAALAAVSTTGEITYPNGDRSVYVDLLFVTEPVDAAVAALTHVGDDENLAVGWFDPDGLPETVNASTIARLDLARRFEASKDRAALFVS